VRSFCCSSDECFCSVLPESKQVLIFKTMLKVTEFFNSKLFMKPNFIVYLPEDHDLK
jgi:hypothetical protein